MWVRVCAYVCKSLRVCVQGFVRICVRVCEYVCKSLRVCV